LSPEALAEGERGLEGRRLRLVVRLGHGLGELARAGRSGSLPRR
jgi:hypothetical protein